jgi:UDP-glucose 4-epimerase
MTEDILRWYSATKGLRSVSLRYFNAAGASADAAIGEDWSCSQNLIPLTMKAILGRRPPLQVFGTDYPTPDGTAIRDYIHVEDLADAHLKALAYLRAGGDSTTLNCGYGRGYSVRELITMVERVAGHAISKREAPRRAGDPPTLVARASRIRNTLGWQPQHDDLKEIVETSLAWERKLAAGIWN